MNVKMSARANRQALARIQELTDMEVLVGIPQSRNQRANGETPSNAALGFIHEFGSPAKNIPARPFLIPGVRSALPRVAPVMERAIRAELAGRTGAARASLDVVGLMVQNVVKMRIRNFIPPPLHPMTIARRLTRRAAYQNANRAAQRRMMLRHLSGKFTPLIDTGQLINSITYIIRRRP